MSADPSQTASKQMSIERHCLRYTEERRPGGAARCSPCGRRWLALLAATVLCVAAPTADAAGAPTTPLLRADFDRLPEGVTPAGLTIHTQFAAPDVVPGVTGSAWRTDGFSSHAEAPLSLDPDAGFTLSLWIALESNPSDLEVPAHLLSPSSIAQQSSGEDGWNLHIDAFGRWGFHVATTSGAIEVPVPRRFPLRRWTHIVVTVDAAQGVVNVLQDGANVASGHGRPGMHLALANVPMRLATPPRLAHIINFTINRLNAAYDLVEVHGRPLTEAEIAALPGPAGGKVPDAGPSLIVPASRFAADHLRPRVHPLPPAGWTNEPHGLVRFNGAWHLFYQRTANGPFKTEMVWGHMTSPDLVHWSYLPDALIPELEDGDAGFDMKGIWSGDVITDGGKAFAFYTSVNHGDRIASSNPGIAMAVSDDADLVSWRKLGPILNSEGVKDFRDPFLWKDEGTWHMLVGAALDTGGGLEHLVLERGASGSHWKRRRFSELSFQIMDPGSTIWEMPVFERLAQDVWVLVANPVGGRISKYGDHPTRAVYWTGTWSGGRFRPFFRDPRPLDLVPGHLAPTTEPGSDGRPRAIGIIDERRTPAAQERAGWANTFSLPRAWFLLPDGKTLGQAPAPELTALRGAIAVHEQGVALGAAPHALPCTLHAYELAVELPESGPRSSPITVDVMASDDGQEFTRLSFDRQTGDVTVDKTRSTLTAEGEGPQLLHGAYDATSFGAMRTLRVFVDGSTIEVFINDAAAYAIRSYPSRASSTAIRIQAGGTSPVPANVTLWPLGRSPG